MDYAHARHAGNAGDVLKHVALIAILEDLLRDPSPLTYVETHAGDGLYPLGSAGEWGEGALRVWGAQDGLLGRYARILRGYSEPGAVRPRAVPGSPLVARALLRPCDRMLLHEIQAQSAGVLRRCLPDAEVREKDGLAALPAAAQGRALVLLDPPYTQKQEWTDAARALETIPGTPAALWYPIKALTRPRALIAGLPRLGVHGVAVELHWTPLRLRRERLNGAGVVLVNVSPAAVASLCAALPELGALLQTHGEWGAMQIGF
ncbi:MAG TPA: 23S rRNA (adenine(2030)-N(6))-methyltransferase RlmJ [Myxococcales bacterium]